MIIFSQLSTEQAENITGKLNSTWKIEEHYWYPLYDSRRDDVIAFNYEYIIDDRSKIVDIHDFLLGLNQNEVYEMHEDRSVRIIDIKSLTPVGHNQHGERFWFTDDMKWIIYASHEGSTTFSGEELISYLKNKWSDWQANLF